LKIKVTYHVYTWKRYSAQKIWAVVWKTTLEALAMYNQCLHCMHFLLLHLIYIDPKIYLDLNMTQIWLYVFYIIIIVLRDARIMKTNGYIRKFIYFFPFFLGTNYYHNIGNFFSTLKAYYWVFFTHYQILSNLLL